MTVLALTPAELAWLHRAAATDAIAHLGGALGGHLSAEQLEHKDFLIVLSDKLGKAVAARPLRARRQSRRNVSAGERCNGNDCLCISSNGATLHAA